MAKHSKRWTSRAHPPSDKGVETELYIYRGMPVKIETRNGETTPFQPVLVGKKWDWTSEGAGVFINFLIERRWKPVSQKIFDAALVKYQRDYAAGKTDDAPVFRPPDRR